MEPNVLMAFSLTLMAGLATGIGSALAFFSKHTNTKFLSLALGFSAGVMIYVSFVEIFFKAQESLTEAVGAESAEWYTVAGFFGGILLTALIDKLVPSVENPHELHHIEEMEPNQKCPKKLMRMGILSALAIGIHNFPEGIATFLSALHDPTMGMTLATAIAIHNIPEGIAVSVPIYFATKSRKKAFWYSFLSGTSEPIGALLAYLVLKPYLTPVMFGVVFSSVAGIMVFISLDQLLPGAEEYGEHHLAIYGLVSGMAIMALSLLLF
jgi:ZIP family zinc transporter